ncbi:MULTISPECIES: mycothiol conjugate amidase Mca [unclassified Actinobaculum]|uniref:mycothiol conjugate amidase Mca n=1 Tax=unclassified Actinobaculum TaxID=2609299 RepID=UPI000D526CB2|nr:MULTISPECIES: mycothiol conjugate amidase Mca [unclassified Actinobaculum]AWE41849.1 mycothiol conjugate amidase Mca [Actinobaculum sp. 313]RTE50233.1 mycothiol conjugate amidase Mca [Actinobaculum sp. 352]
MATERRLMAVHAHPDDESSKGAGMMAKYAQVGRVRVVTCTGGERGSILNPHFVPAYPDEPMTDIRRREMAQAAQALGIEHHWLGFVDSGLPDGYPDVELPGGCFAVQPLEIPVKALVSQIREFRPQVLTCYDERGGYPHPDHVRSHVVAMEAVRKAADPGLWPELGEAWQVSKVYYDLTFNARRLRTLDRAIRRAGHESPYASLVSAREDLPEAAPSARINVGDFFPQRDAALRAHASQIDPEGFFFACPRDIEKENWPWEEFVLALSMVGEPSGIVDDLFARVPGVEHVP